MRLYQYTVKGDPAQLLAVWDKAVETLSKEELFLNLVAEGEDGITIVDVCPTEADFQGWINGDDWRRVKAELGGDVAVTPLGPLRSAIARDTVVEVTHAPAHAH